LQKAFFLTNFPMVSCKISFSRFISFS
jgi:hypothetical protein